MRSEKKPLELVWDPNAEKDFAWWRRHDKRIAERIEALVVDVQKHPFTGLGKPEPLRWEWQGYWSRRITDEHRLLSRRSGRTLHRSVPLHYSPKKTKRTK
ncbi:MAG: Txe/YoeB family addiction module toxin [Burkholderiales bacterium]